MLHTRSPGPTGVGAAKALQDAGLQPSVWGRWGHGELRAMPGQPGHLHVRLQSAAQAGTDMLKVCRWGTLKQTKNIFLLWLPPQRQRWWGLLFAACALLSEVNISLALHWLDYQYYFPETSRSCSKAISEHASLYWAESASSIICYKALQEESCWWFILAGWGSVASEHEEFICCVVLFTGKLHVAMIYSTEPIVRLLHDPDIFQVYQHWKKSQFKCEFKS